MFVNDLIMMPKLEAGKLCMKKNRSLTTKTARSKCWQNGSHFLHSIEEYTIRSDRVIQEQAENERFCEGLST